MITASVIDEASIPRLPRGVRLKYDEPRQQWVLLAPERMFVLDDIALEIVKECDGQATIAIIVNNLAARFQAPREIIAKDVHTLLQDFADKGVMTT